MSKEETIGSLLRKARLKKGLTLEDAYKALKIQPKILDLLEKDTITQAMHKIYVQSFIKKYARYLNVDLNKFLSGPSFAPPQPRQGRDDKIDIGPSPENTWRQYLLISVTAITLIVALSLIASAGLKIFKNVKKKTTPPAPLTAGKKAAAVIKKEEPQVAKPSNKPSLPIPKGEMLSLKIEARENVWMRVKADGKIIFEHTLKKASVETWSAKKELELWVGKAEALNLSLNGVSLASPGSGRIKRIVINHNGLTVEEK